MKLLAVFVMAKIEQEGNSIPDSEKKSICHLATMLMEVGMALAASEEDVYQK